MKGWLDKYGKEINANEGHSSAQENWVGEGYSNVGRNYSPAWGGQFQKGGTLPPIYTDDPADPRLHSYLDSLNLYKAHQTQLKYNPRTDWNKSHIGKIYSDPNTSFDTKQNILKNKNAAKNFLKATLKEKKEHFKSDPKRANRDSYKSKKELVKASPKDLPLINAYEKLNFSSPTETGLWTTPDLWNANVAPVGIYFGGSDERGAWNPIFQKPVQPIEYQKDASDYMVYRDAPTIYGTSHIFHPKRKLTDKLQVKKPTSIQEEKNILSNQPVDVQPTSTNNKFFSKITELKHPDLQLPNIPKGPTNVGWNVEYFDPKQKKTVTQSFGSNEEAEQFYNDPANKASMKYSDASSVGRFQKGGELTAKQLDSLNKAKMKAKMALASEFGNPAARRMMNPTPPSYRFSGNEMIDGQNVVGFGENQVQLPATGTHYMGSMGEYAVPYIQQGASGNLQFNPNASPDDREAMKFDNPEDAAYFAEHYKEVAPMMRSFAKGGKFQDGGELSEKPDYERMAPFYKDLFGAADKYKNPKTEMVSPLNSARATAKAFIKHPDVLFMKRHRLPEGTNPYGVEPYTVNTGFGRTQTFTPTDWAESKRQRKGKYNINNEITNKDFGSSFHEYNNYDDYEPNFQQFDFSQFNFPEFDFSQFENLNNRAYQPDINFRQEPTLKETTPYYNDSVVFNYKSPEGNSAEGIRAGGSQGVPVSGMAAMGGSIPGSVGFTYARTAGSAPSNGPYAKKTKASAQNGKEMSYYQHGLDWKPKGMQIGGLLDKFSKNKEQVVNQLSNLPIYSPDARYSEYKGNVEDWKKNLEGVRVEENPNLSDVTGFDTPGSYFDKSMPSPLKEYPYAGTVQLDPNKFNEIDTRERVLGHELTHGAFDGSNFIPNWYADNLKNTARNPEGKEHQDLLSERAAQTMGVRRDIVNKYGLKPDAKIPRDLYDSYLRDHMNTDLRTNTRTESGELKESLFSARNASDLHNLLNMENVPKQKNGGWLDKYTPQAQTGDFILPDPRDLQRQMVNASESTAPTSKQTTTGVSKENMASSTRDMGKVKQREREEEKARVKERQSAKAIKEGKAKTFTFPTGESKSLDQMDAREKAYVTGKSVEGKGRFFENEESIIDDLSPLTWISEAAGALGAAPYEAREYDSNLPYAGAIGSALFQGALGFDPLGGAIKFAKNPVTKSVAKTLVDIPRAENIKEAIGRVGGIPLKKDIPRMGAQDVKALRQVQEIGRLRATNSPMAEQMKYGLENDLPEEHFQKVFGKSREEAQHLLNTGFGEQEAARSASIRESIDLRRPSRPNAELARLREQNRFEPVEMTPEEMAISNRGADLDLDLGANDVVDFNPESIVRQSQRDAMRARFREFDAADEAILSESDMLNLSNQNIDRSQAVQNIVDRFSEPRLSYTQLSPEAVERIQRYSRELDNQLPPPPEYINLNIDNPRRGRTIIPGQERSRIPLSMQLKQDVTSGVNKFSNKLENFVGNRIQNYPFYNGEVLEKVPSLSLAGSGNLKNVSKKVNFAPEGIKSGDVFTGSTNTSHSSYLPQLKQVFKYTKGDPQFLGYRPMNTMGFLSQYGYGEGDIAKYLNSEIDEQIKRGIIPKNIQRPFLKNDRVSLPHYGVKQHMLQHRQGGVIEDDMGQWAHPGKITKINSNQITMKGVDYPVLGISDAGDQQMMYPDQEYTFKGKTVTEYPQKKKNGGWLEKYN